MKNMQIRDRILKLMDQVSKDIYEKENIFKLSTLAMLSGESIFLLGKPGVAKSLVARRMKYLFKNGRVFEYLMNRFSTPEEIYGPISITKLQEGMYERLINNYLPNVDIAFLDEIWKAGPSIQNTLLTIINEKIFRNGDKEIIVPLKLLISASNELPEPNQGLEALFDRFIIRYIVYGLANQNNFNKMIAGTTDLVVKVDSNLQITNSEYQHWLKESAKVQISDLTLKFIDRFRKAIHEETNGEAYISDRRWKKIVGLMKVSAYFNGRNETDKPDWIIITHCIWDTVEQFEQYTRLFDEIFKNALTFELNEKKEELENKLDNLNQELNDVQSQNIKPSVYTNPFKGQLVGNYHRLLWINRDFPICFISIDDYHKVKTSTINFESIKLYFGKTLNHLDSHIRVDLRYHNDNEFIDNKKITYSVEIEDLESTLNRIKQINKVVDKTAKDIKKLNKEFKLEKERLLSLSAIFFDDQYKMVLNSAFVETETVDEEKFEFLDIMNI